MKRNTRAPAQGSEIDFPVDTPQYLATWARELVKTAGKAEARQALAEYRRLAADKKVPKLERKAAAARAEAIEKRL